MSDRQKQFDIAAEKVAFDKEHRRKIRYNMSKYDQAVEKGKKLFSDLEVARERASKIKLRVLQNLDKHIIDFRENFEKQGGKVLFAGDAKEAAQYVLDIANRKEARFIVKSKSMITEEIELNDLLTKNGIESLETDLGEYIVQIAGEKPYHIVTPAMHKSRKDIAELFHRIHDTPEESSPEELTFFVRQLLRNKFI
ncbi:MAG: LUD domain-containing protein, partial [Bacteroidetes bacterium]|nr:LUD domain-containing protein [Bacteroidota bacterium]